MITDLFVVKLKQFKDKKSLEYVFNGLIVIIDKYNNMYIQLNITKICVLQIFYFRFYIWKFIFNFLGLILQIFFMTQNVIFNKF